MSSLLEMIAGTMNTGDIGRMSSQIGASPEATQKALTAAIPVLVQAMARNASSPGGASALAGALERDHDGSILDNIGGFLDQGGTSDGNAILGHLLGGNRSQVESRLSATSGLDMASIGKLLAMVAPLLLGATGRVKKDQGLDTGGLAEILGGESRRISENPQLDALGRMLDSDGDGQVLDDVAKLGSSILGGLLGGRR